MKFEVTVRSKPVVVTSYIVIEADDEEDAIVKAQNGEWTQADVVHSEEEPDTLPLYDVTACEAVEK